jgi:hypothetical protein
MKKYLEFPEFCKALVVFALFMLLQELADLALQAGPAILGCLALTGIRRKCGPRPGGNKRLYLCPVENFQDVEFPTYDMATAGEITVPIPVITGKKFIEIQATYDSTKWGFASKGKTGNQSFEQNISFEVSRLDKESIALASRLLNNPVVIIAVSNTGIPFFLGSTEVPLELEIGGDSGAKGTDPTKMTFTCKNDGYMFPAIPLADTAIFAIEPLPAVVAE